MIDWGGDWMHWGSGLGVRALGGVVTPIKPTPIFHTLNTLVSHELRLVCNP